MRKLNILGFILNRKWVKVSKLIEYKWNRIFENEKHIVSHEDMIKRYNKDIC